MRLREIVTEVYPLREEKDMLLVPSFTGYRNLAKRAISRRTCDYPGGAKNHVLCKDLPMKYKFLLLLPALVKASAYILMGVGGVANATGYHEVGGALLAVASVIGLKDVSDTAHDKEN